MAATEWIWTLPCIMTLLGLAAWTWQAAGDVRDLEGIPDHQMLRAIASHQRGPDVVLPPAPVMHRAGFDQRQLQP